MRNYRTHTNLRKRKNKKRRPLSRNCVSYKMQRLPAFMIIKLRRRGGEWRDPRSKERGWGRGYEKRRDARYIRVKVVCFYVSGRPDRRRSIVAHVSCPIVPSIAATHEIALCMHTRTHMHTRTIQMRALRCAWSACCTIQTRVLYREGPSGDRFSLSASVATRTSVKRRIILE